MTAHITENVGGQIRSGERPCLAHTLCVRDCQENNDAMNRTPQTMGIGWAMDTVISRAITRTQYDCGGPPLDVVCVTNSFVLHVLIIV